MSANDEKQSPADLVAEGGPDLADQDATVKLMAQRISAARREAGYRTAQDFAEELQVSVWTVRSWESGKSQPRYDMLRTISQVTSRPAAWFLGESAPQQDVERAIHRILEQYQLRANQAVDAEGSEPGVYGIAPFNAAAERELHALSADAKRWGLLIRLTRPASPTTAEQLATLHLALAALLTPAQDEPEPQ